MKTPAFDHSRRRWDQYGQFYNNLSGHRFILFESGELMINHGTLDPDARRVYDAFNLELFSTIDAYKFKLTTPDGEPVPKAWLNQGGAQQLVRDLDTGKVHYLNGGRGRLQDDKYPVPKHASHSSIYWAGAGREPVIRRSISLAKPDAEFKETHKEWMSQVRAACIAKSRLLGLSAYRYSEQHELVDTQLAQSVEAFCASLSDWNTAEIAANGFQQRRAVVEVPYLLVKE
jgi:hypothetical protein